MLRVRALISLFSILIVAPARFFHSTFFLLFAAPERQQRLKEFSIAIRAKEERGKENETLCNFWNTFCCTEKGIPRRRQLLLGKDFVVFVFLFKRNWLK
jgi:hypothetical protein